MIPHWICWPHVKHAARHGIKQHRRHRIGRTIKRGAGAIMSKPAAVVWVCVAGGGGWLAWPEQQVSAGAPPNVAPPLSTGASTLMLAPDHLLPPEFIAPGMFAFAPAPDFTMVPPPVEQPKPEQPPRVPEPASLLAVPFAATAILLRRRT